MARLAQIDIEKLYEQHEQLLSIQAGLTDLLVEANPDEHRIAESLRELAQRMLDQLEDVLDSEASRAAMEDVQLHGAVPWEEVEAELRK